VTRVGLGGGPLGNLFTALTDDDAAATVHAAWDAGVRYFDTAPLYGHGLSEQRLGRALAAYPRDEFVVSTKVGRLLRPDLDFDPGIFRVPRGVAPRFDYSRDGVRRSLDESLERLGMDRIDIALVHDPDDHEEDALDGAFPALVELRDQGVLRAVGAGMNQHEMLSRFVARVDLDCVLLAGRYSLLDRSGAGFVASCAEAGVGVILGGVLNSGILASGANPSAATFDYEPAPAAIVDRAMALAHECDRAGVALPEAALQFVAADPAVTAIVVGARSPEEIRCDVTWSLGTLPPPLLSWLREPTEGA
jgi:D-threo-aldose 1-dehydrogenase